MVITLQNINRWEPERLEMWVPLSTTKQQRLRTSVMFKFVGFISNITTGEGWRAFIVFKGREEKIWKELLITYRISHSSHISFYLAVFMGTIVETKSLFENVTKKKTHIVTTNFYFSKNYTRWIFDTRRVIFQVHNY